MKEEKNTIFDELSLAESNRIIAPTLLVVLGGILVAALWAVNWAFALVAGICLAVLVEVVYDHYDKYCNNLLAKLDEPRKKMGA